MLVVNFIDQYKNIWMKKNELKILEELHEKTKRHPDRALFLSVIFQALVDVTKPININEKTSIKLMRDRAASWFFASIGVTCENFEFICDSAGVDPKDIRKFAFHVVNSDKGGKIRTKILTLLG